ncbi:MAG TPA: ketoacyl-ACP synthase III, partial [Flavobacteriales bacterium]|nr:ketoacyl-ACP synthase III [Flavobacteriales bacterium]
QSKIIGLGKYVPENIVTNNDLTKYMDTSDEWIRERTGIEERRWANQGDGNTAATMGVKAAKIALERANLSPKDIDFIVFATLSPDYYFPGGGVQVQDMLGCDTIGALDVRNQCSGFVYALATADQFIKTGMYKNVLVIGAELQSLGIDKTTRGRGIGVIFGDGAGAVVLTRSDDESGILSNHLHSEGKYAKELTTLVPGGPVPPKVLVEDWDPNDLSYYPYMNGNFVFKHAVTRFPEAIMEGLTANNLTTEDIDLLIPHQANLRISQFVQRKLKMRDEQIMNNIQKYGNTTAASIPIALTEAWEEGRIKKGDLVVTAAFGSGFTWGSNIIRF